jgi:hypothetical protein
MMTLKNFVGNRSELFYLYLQVQEKPQLQPIIVIHLPKEVFFDSAQPERTINTAC